MVPTSLRPNGVVFKFPLVKKGLTVPLLSGHNYLTLQSMWKLIDLFGLNGP